MGQARAEGLVDSPYYSSARAEMESRGDTLNSQPWDVMATETLHGCKISGLLSERLHSNQVALLPEGRPSLLCLLTTLAPVLEFAGRFYNAPQKSI